MTSQQTETPKDRAADRRPDLISVVLPAHNEANGIRRTIAKLDAVLQTLAVPYEMIVVDDGSRDETFAAVRKQCAFHTQLRGIKFSRNFGKEAALLAGIKSARGDVIVTMDADLQHPPELIPEMLAHWGKGAVVVHGVKRKRGNDSLLNRTAASIFNQLFLIGGGIDLRNASDFKLLDRAAADVIVARLPERHRFYRGLAGWIGFPQHSIAFDVEARTSDRGNWSLRALLGLATTAFVSFTSAPLRLITLLGAVTLIFGILVGAEALWSWFRGVSVSGFVTIIITILLLGSFIMISLGIIGEYIAKIYDEVKQRPAYLIESSCGADVDQASD